MSCRDMISSRRTTISFTADQFGPVVPLACEVSRVPQACSKSMLTTSAPAGMAAATPFLGASFFCDTPQVGYYTSDSRWSRCSRTGRYNPDGVHDAQAIFTLSVSRTGRLKFCMASIRDMLAGTIVQIARDKGRSLDAVRDEDTLQGKLG